MLMLLGTTTYHNRLLASKFSSSSIFSKSGRYLVGTVYYDRHMTYEGLKDAVKS